MTQEIVVFAIILLVMIILFVTEKVTRDVTSLLVLLLFILLGFLTPQEAFSGFSSVVVLTLIPIYIIGAGMRYTGLADVISARVYRFSGTSEILNVLAVMIMGVLASSVMNKVAAVALLLPTVVGISHRTKIPPSRLLIPLCFAVMLGGTTILIGTASNIVASQVLVSHKLPGFSVFDFTPYGLSLVAVGLFYMVFIGRRLLPSRTYKFPGNRDVSLASLYRLDERIFPLRVPYDSSLHKQSLSSLHFGESLDVSVISIIRQGEKILAPGPSEVTRAGDILIARGRKDELQDLLRFKGVETADFTEVDISKNFARKALLLKDSEEGKSLADLKLTKRFGVIVTAIEKSDKVFFKYIAAQKLSGGDRLHILGSASDFESLSKEFEIQEIDGTALAQKKLLGSLFLIEVPEFSRLSGVSIQDSRMGELAGVTICALIREGVTEIIRDPSILLMPFDKLVVAGDLNRIEYLAHLGELEILAVEEGITNLESDEIGLTEVLVAPRSELLNKTLTEVGFREKYGMSVLALWREAKLLRARLSRIPLRFGDALLLHGPRSKMQFFAKDPNFVALGDTREVTWRTNKAFYSLFSIVLFIVLSAGGFQAVEVSAWIAAIVLVLSGAISMEVSYREIDWRSVLLVAALLPLGIVAQKLDLIPIVSNFLTLELSHFGPFVMLLALAILSSLITQILDGTLAVILLAPIAIGISQTFGVNAQTCVMMVALSASNAFLTPFSHRSHLLVMGIGGYTVGDYFKVGFWLSLLFFAVASLGIYFNL